MLLIDDLFGIDAEARAQSLDWGSRDQLRQQQARPLLETIREQIEAARGQALPASKLGGAITYTLGLWERLEKFLDYPALELSTNLAETLRPPHPSTRRPSTRASDVQMLYRSKWQK